MDLKKREDGLNELIAILQRAHAAERAAFLAYDGHIRAIKRRKGPGYRKTLTALKQMQHDEFVHRQVVGFMLIQLRSAPGLTHEIIFTLVGHFISFLGYILPTAALNYGAKVIERIGKLEYDEASKIAWKLKHRTLAMELKAMARKEFEHEKILLAL